MSGLQRLRPICWFSPQVPTRVGVGQPAGSSTSGCVDKGARTPGPSALLCLTSEPSQSGTGFQLVPAWDANLTHSATMFTPKQIF